MEQPNPLDPKEPLPPEGGRTVNLDAEAFDGGEDLSDLMEDASADGDISVEVVPFDDDSDTESQIADPRGDFKDALVQAERQMEDLIQREAALIDQHKRLAADFNNFRNRANRDIQLSVDQSERRILAEILPVLDNMERGLDATYADMASFRNGVELIHKQFYDALRRLGAEPVSLSVGDPFDALTSEALTTMANPDLPDGAVAAVYEKGFKLRDQLIRPARVVVNRVPTDGPTQ
jgi:molecular chaperone GrpE